MPFVSEAQARDALRDLALPQTVLADVAYRYPSLREQVACHPMVYPELLAWLSRHPASGNYVLTVTGPVGQRFELAPGYSASVGRLPDQTLQILDPYVSNHHLDIQWVDDHWDIADASSTNGTFVGTEPVNRWTITGASRVTLGGVTGPALTLTIGPSGAPSATFETSAPTGQVFGLGRETDNAYVIADVLASRHHAELRIGADGGMWLRDLGSLNGTQVNGQPVQQALLGDGDTVTIGNTDLVVRGGDLVPVSPEAETDLVVRGVDFTVSGGIRLLHGIDLAASMGTLTALIGPSGAGKSTLGRLVTGITTPSAGQVLFAGHDLHANYAALRSRIGFVPQDDVVHPKLTVRQALDYAAELRLPPDTTKEERDAVCASVMEELDLEERADLRVEKLSGGQRKRVSVAIELITSPTLLVLDEPTSGLDPALDRQVMELLARLARGGRIVLVVTHSLAYLHLSDNVLLLAPGGLPVYQGPPGGVQAAFGTNDWATVFQQVNDSPQELWERYERRLGRTPGEDEPVAVPPETRPAKESLLPQAPAATRRREARRQTATLLRRQVRLLVADVGYGVFLAGLPFILGALALVVPGSSGLGPPAPLAFGEQPSLEPNEILVLLILGACFMGASLSVRDLVGERAIFHRERSAGLSPGAYIISKLLVFGAASLVQSFILVGIVLIGKPHPGHGAFIPSGSVELMVDVALVSACSMAVGLLLSALVHSSEQAMPVLVVVTMGQLVMSGGLISVTGRAGLQQLAAIFPGRWGFAAGSSTIDMRTLLGPICDQDNLWNHDARAWLLSIGIQLGMTVVLAFLAYRRLRFKRGRT